MKKRAYISVYDKENMQKNSLISDMKFYQRETLIII